MSQLNGSEQQWMKYVENELGAGKLDVTLPQKFIHIDNAINLALKLNVTLILADQNYVFTAAGQPKKGVSSSGRDA